MSVDRYLESEERNKNVGLLITALLHLLLSLLCFYNFITYYDPPLPPKNGIVVAFNLSDIADEQSEVTEKQEKEASESAPNEAKVKENKVESRAPTKSQNESTPPEKTSTTVVDESPIITKQDKKPKRDLEAERKERLRKEAEARAKAKKEAEEKKQAELDQSKKKFSSILNKGKAASNTNGNNSGDGGSDALERMSEGVGTKGRNLGNRTVIYAPKINENSQKTGKVAVEICLNKEGRVTSAKYTQKGSTTTDSKLVDVAERAAKKYVFSPADADQQCGIIYIEFKLK